MFHQGHDPCTKQCRDKDLNKEALSGLSSSDSHTLGVVDYGKHRS